MTFIIDAESYESLDFLSYPSYIKIFKISRLDNFILTIQYLRVSAPPREGFCYLLPESLPRQHRVAPADNAAEVPDTAEG